MIVGNPPYVKYNLAKTDLPEKSVVKCGNLYMYFIEKCFNMLVNQGILNFILPKESLVSTQGAPLRKIMFEQGTITHYIDYQEKRMFEDASPQVITIRYQKGNLSHKTKYIDKTSNQREEMIETLERGKYVFKDKKCKKVFKISDFYSVCVGLVSGCNKVFRVPEQILNRWTDIEKDNCIIPVLCSDKKIRPHLFVDSFFLDHIQFNFVNVYAYLREHEITLRKRKIVKITDSNWYKWGAI